MTPLPPQGGAKSEHLNSPPSGGLGGETKGKNKITKNISI